MVKVGDKVRSLVDYDGIKKGKVYRVDSLYEFHGEVLGAHVDVDPYESASYLENSEFEIVGEEEIQNTERYKTGSGKQLFDVFEDDLLSYIEARGFYKANIIKYTHRYKHKGGIEDLKKVKVYVDQLIKLEEKQNEV